MKKDSVGERASWVAICTKQNGTKKHQPAARNVSGCTVAAASKCSGKEEISEDYCVSGFVYVLRL